MIYIASMSGRDFYPEYISNILTIFTITKYVNFFLFILRNNYNNITNDQLHNQFYEIAYSFFIIRFQSYII